MRQSDPNRLSVAAAQLFGNLSGPGDTVGLASFSDRASLLVPVDSPESATSKQALQRSLQGLQFNGQTTDLAAALEAGLTAFHDREDRSHRRLVLLLTDGALDLGKYHEEQEAAARTRILDSLLPEYRQRDISLYTIAFTNAADQGLLKEMAAASAGESRFVGDAQTLHKAFSQIFIGAAGAQSFPLEKGSLQIDASIQELSLVFAKSAPDEKIALLTPQQRTVQAGNTTENMTWQSTPAYELVRMHQPQAGTWQIQRSGDVQSGVGIIAESTLNLQIELGTAFVETGAPLTIRSFLEDESQVPSRIHHEEGQTVTAEVDTPDGPLEQLQLVAQADGSFTAPTPVLNASGRYSITITATTPTLQRQRTRTFEVHPECFLASAVPAKVQVTLHSSCPSFKALSIEAEYLSKQAKQRVPLLQVQPHLFEAKLPSATGPDASLIIRGESSEEGEFSLTKGPLPLPTPAPPPIAEPVHPAPAAAAGMGKALLWVGGLIIAALLITSVVLAMLLRRSRRALAALHVDAPAPAQIEEPEDDAEPAPAAVPVSPEPPPAAPESEAIAISLDTPPDDVAPIETSDAIPDAVPAEVASIANELEQLREIVDNAKLDESTERLQQRLDATQQSLQDLAVDLEQRATDTSERKVDIEPLQTNLKEMASEVDSLQQNNAQLQRDLRHKAEDMEKSIAEEQENTDRVLHHAKKLRRDMSMLREKLKNRESDVQQLQTTNDALAAEYNALMKEYERVYSNTQK